MRLQQCANFFSILGSAPLFGIQRASEYFVVTRGWGRCFTRRIWSLTFSVFSLAYHTISPLLSWRELRIGHRIVLWCWNRLGHYCGYYELQFLTHLLLRRAGHRFAIMLKGRRFRVIRQVLKFNFFKLLLLVFLLIHLLSLSNEALNFNFVGERFHFERKWSFNDMRHLLTDENVWYFRMLLTLDV